VKPLKEILVLHHSHLDVGYTHSQPIIWELQREYIDLALDLLDQTADWPEISQPKWTCEVTAPVTRWLKTACDKNVARFAHHLRQGRMGISAMQYNTTPLCTAEQLLRQMYPVKELRERFGIKLNTLHQHDVNGLPWPMVDLMLDSGIELLVMAVNVHLGGAVKPRPGVFRWQGPSGRDILVMNGNHYTMFDQLFYTWDHRVDRMQEGLAEYLKTLEKIEYSFDFLYLTSTSAPQMWDNAPPNPAVARLISEWNQRELNPPIRYVTTEELLQRIKQIPAESLPVLAGDWTDYWNFGCASTACETRLNRRTKPILFTAEMLQSARGASAPRPALADVSARAWASLNLYDEHTWGYWNPDPDLPPMRAQALIKKQHAYEAAELADYLLIDALEALAGNPPQSQRHTHALLVNPTSRARQYYVPVPKHWREEAKRLRCEQFSYHRMYHVRQNEQLCGPIDVPAYGWKKVPIDSLAPAPNDDRIAITDSRANVEKQSLNNNFEFISRRAEGATTIESPFHRLTFDPSSGRIQSLFDKKRNWEVIATGDFTFCEFVRERTDALHDERREAYYDRDLIKEKFDQSCWKPDWKAVRERAVRVTSCRLERGPVSAALVLELEAPSVRRFSQRITLRADSPMIELDVAFEKLDCRTPEAIYFAFPLNLPAGWDCHFDTAGMPVELDREQLPGASRGWFTAESYTSVHAGDRGVTLFCPDAPMIQAGGFHFGRKHDSIARDKNPLLLAWPLNNYWNTNYPLTQPGYITLHYAFLTHGKFDPVQMSQDAQSVSIPMLAHPAFCVDGKTEGQLLHVAGKGIVVQHVKPAADGRGFIVRLMNLKPHPVQVQIILGHRPATHAALCNALEEIQQPLKIVGVNGAAAFEVPPRRLTTIKLECRESR